MISALPVWRPVESAGNSVAPVSWRTHRMCAASTIMELKAASAARGVRPQVNAQTPMANV